MEESAIGVKDKVLIVDIANQIYRSSITFGNSKKKEESVWGDFPSPTEIKTEIPEEYTLIYQFFRNFRAQIEMFQPNKVFAVLEGHPQFRYDLYPEYKANRIIKTGSQLETRNKVEKGRPEILRLLKMLPITQVRAEKYEADDVIYTLVDNMREEDLTVISSDKDFICLLQKGYQHISLFNPLNKSNREVPIYNQLAFRALSGDKSDNIKGIVGEARAKTLAGSPEKLRLFLETEENRAHFNINRQLMELRLVPLEELIIEEGEANFEELYLEFKNMQMETIIREPYFTRFKDTFITINI